VSEVDERRLRGRAFVTEDDRHDAATHDEIASLAHRWARRKRLDDGDLQQLVAETSALGERLKATGDVDGLLDMLSFEADDAEAKPIVDALASLGEDIVAPLLDFRNRPRCPGRAHDRTVEVLDALDQEMLRRVLRDIDCSQFEVDVREDVNDILCEAEARARREAGEEWTWRGEDSPGAAALGAWAADCFSEHIDRRPRRSRPMTAEVRALLDRWYAAADAEDAAALGTLVPETGALVERFAHVADAWGLADLLDLPAVEAAEPLLKRIPEALVSIGLPALDAVRERATESGGSPAGSRARAVGRRLERLLPDEG
jgi:hypothetical protein